MSTRRIKTVVIREFRKRERLEKAELPLYLSLELTCVGTQFAEPLAHHRRGTCGLSKQGPGSDKTWASFQAST